MTVLGLDASSVQGALPIKALHDQGVRFLIHKCKQGNDGKDPMFDRNIAAARNAGWRVGSYHFLYPLPHLDPAKQAEGFFAASSIGSAQKDLPPALDLEWPDPDKGWANWGCTAPQIADWSRRCAERVEQLFGRKPLIYIYPYFAQRLRALGGDVAWLANYPLWIASYGAKPSIPAPWATWALWQYDGNGGEKMPNGVDADYNRFNGGEEELAAFCGAMAPPAPPALHDVSRVKGQQEALTLLGYTPGPADGKRGPRTTAAIVAFQKDHGLTPDGDCGPKTKAALAAALSAGYHP